MPEKIRIIVVDEHKLFRMAMIALLEREDFEIAGVFNNAEQFINSTITDPLPDIFFFSYKSKQPNNLKAVKWIKANYPSVKILAGALFKYLVPAEEFKQIGIDGVIIKSYCDPHEVVNAFKSIYQGQIFYPDFLNPG